MSNIKWIKISTDMFYDEKIRLIDALPERDSIFYVWIRLLIQAGICNQDGDIFLSTDEPYTSEMLATLFSRPIDSIKVAVQVLGKFGMIDILEDGRIRVVNWAKHQNIEGMDKVREQNRIRSRKKREREKSSHEEEDLCDDSKVTATLQGGRINKSNVTVTEQREIKNKNKNIELDKERENIDEITSEAEKILSYYENITGIVGIFSLSSLKVCIAHHGAKYLKIAINKALRVNKPNMEYVNGILKNWRKEGYPKLESDLDVGGQKYSIASDESKEFKPQLPRTLSREEREEAEKNLI